MIKIKPDAPDTKAAAENDAVKEAAKNASTKQIAQNAVKGGPKDVKKDKRMGLGRR